MRLININSGVTTQIFMVICAFKLFIDFVLTIFGSFIVYFADYKNFSYFL